MSDPFFLLGKRLAPRTRARYSSAVSKFLLYYDLSRNELLSFRERSSDLSDLDRFLCNYVHYIFAKEKGAGRGQAECALYGVLSLYVPRARGKLFLTQEALAGWKKQKPPAARPPLIRAVVFKTAEWLWQRGKLLEGVAVLLTFGAFLRISELVNLQVEDIALGENSLTRARGVHIRQAKTGENQFAEVRDPQIMKIVRYWLKLSGAREGEPAFPVSQRELRLSLRDALQGLRVVLPGATFHSLRHGAATQARLDGETILAVMERGRWAASKSAKLYIKRSMVLGLIQKLPQNVIERGKALESEEALVHTFKENLSSKRRA